MFPPQGGGVIIRWGVIIKVGILFAIIVVIMPIRTIGCRIRRLPEKEIRNYQMLSLTLLLLKLEIIMLKLIIKVCVLP